MNPANAQQLLQNTTEYLHTHPLVNGIVSLGFTVLALLALYRVLLTDGMAQLRRKIPWFEAFYARKKIKELVELGEYAQAGDQLLAMGQQEQAIEIYEEGNLFGRVADIYLRKKQFDRAATFYERSGDYRKACEIFLDLKQYERAEALMEKTSHLEELPDLYRKKGVLDRAAEVHLRLGHLEDAAHIFAELRKVRKAAELLVKSYEMQKKEGLPADQSGLEAARMLETAGDHKQAALIYSALGKNSDAARNFAKAGDPTRAAEIYEQIGDFAKASELFAQGGNSANANRLVAENHFQSGRLSESALKFAEIGDYNRAGEIFHDLQDLEQAAQMYEKGKEYGQAASLYKELQLLEDAARCFELNDEFNEAIQCYRKLNRPDREADLYKKAGDFVGVAESLHRAGKTDEALSVLDGVAETNPRFRSAVSMKGRIYLDQGNPMKAKEFFERSLKNLEKLGSDDIESIYNLAIASEQTQTESQAMQIIEKALAQGSVEQEALPRAETVRKLLADRAFTKMSMAVSNTAASKLFAGSEAAMTSNVTALKSQRYTVMNEIGRGGMGSVYLAKDKTLDRTVALKILHSSFKSNEQAVQTFLREAKAAASLTHPNIVTVHDAGIQDGNYYIAMELVEGKTIKQILKVNTKLSKASTLEVLRQLLDALAYAHSKKIVHRDLSNNNIMWTRQKSVKIMDFGLAKVVKDLASEQSIVGGTPSYMSPEQTLGSPIDHRTDIYSLGICIFEMLLGELPFKQGDLGYHHLHTAPPSARQIDPNIPEVMSGIILKCMEKKPENRFQSVAEITQLLKTLK